MRRPRPNAHFPIRSLAVTSLAVTSLAGVVVACVLWGGGSASTLAATGSQDPPPTTAAPIITTTLPEANGDLGRIIPLPNSGVEPAGPGDRGGWQQLALFIMVCMVIVGMGVFVWWRSRKARYTRRAAGHDRVAMAKAHGGDVRRPRPPGITD